ncbi:hypothetical protein HRbin28_00120 [bacterium HR28]|nr:hypothetical protein HRbin28_00120 [bacterium HR28]
MLRGMCHMTTSKSLDPLLSDQHACRRIVWALKAGRPPREGVRFLSVGMDRVLNTVDSVLQRAAAGQVVSPLVVQGDYGEGKSHLLRFLAEEARARGLAWVVVTHDREQNLGLHKPAWLLRHVLWELRWNYPSTDLGRWEHLLSWPPDYNTDRDMRARLATYLGYLAKDLRSQGFHGLVLCLDELENYTLLATRQKPIFREVLELLALALEPAVVLVFAMTYSQNVPPVIGHRIHPPALDETIAVLVAERIRQLHSVAFGWQPPISPEKLAERAWKRALSVPSGRWRFFVQIVVTLLEVLHQSKHPTVLQRAIPVASATKVLPPEQTPNPLPRASTRPPQPARPKLQVGDWVEILGGHFRGWNGRIQSINGERLYVVVEGRIAIRVQVHASQVRRVRP